uniref:4-coumarate--CoA ligase n=1 Tax=Opuntia streptacantha TaxID=393608 RepID=A0A7C8YME0_OPUST
MHHSSILFLHVFSGKSRLKTSKKMEQNGSPRPLPSSETEPDKPVAGSWRSIEGLVRCSAKYTPLTPVSFLHRAAKVFADRTAAVYEPPSGSTVRLTWRETRQRCLQLASALRCQIRISPGDIVASLALNGPAMYELHFAVPMAGAILSTLNPRLNSATLSILLGHSETKVLFVDYQLLETAQEAIELLANTGAVPPLPVLISDSDTSLTILNSVKYGYESLLATGDINFQAIYPTDEWDPISVNYTSGTTSRPKGVVYNHRGGSPPPPQVLFKMEELGFEVTHIYGLTETYGAGTYCLWKPEWDSLPPNERSRIKARQGVQHLGLEAVDVRDPFTMDSLPADGIFFFFTLID